MSSVGKDYFCRMLKKVRLPNGYSSNISSKVRMEGRTLKGLKSHDHHILLQFLLPIAARRSLPKNMVDVLIEVASFFRQLCSRINKKSDLEQMQGHIPLTLCHLERIFRPALFDVIEHLPVHLARDALVASCVSFKSMWPIERYLYTLKQYVRDQARPEGSIVSGYLIEECMHFCGRYFKDVDIKLNREPRNHDNESTIGRTFGQCTLKQLDRRTWNQAHKWVLDNYESLEQYKNLHKLELKGAYPECSDSDNHMLHNQSFAEWFKAYATTTTDESFSLNLKKLSVGPGVWAKYYDGCIVSVFRFRTKDSEKGYQTQNSGVVCKATTMEYTSKRNSNPRSIVVNYYGFLRNIIEISYGVDMKYILFECDWIDNEKGFKHVEFKFSLVNFNNLMIMEDVLAEPFIFSTQAEQVWYWPLEGQESEWNVVMSMTRRDNFDVYSMSHDVDPHPQHQLDEQVITDEQWVRQGVEPTVVHGIVTKRKELDMDNHTQGSPNM